jgi:putative DNA primase/helicase
VNLIQMPAPAPGPDPMDPFAAGIAWLAALPDDAFIVKKEGVQVVSAARAIDGQIPYGWNPTEGRFYVYADGRWRPGDNVIRQAIAALFGERHQPAMQGNVKLMLECLPGVRQISVEPVAEVRWINVENGLVDWHTGELHPHRMDECGVTQIPVEWHDDAACPAFETFLGQVLPPDFLEPSVQCPTGFIWEVIGYALYSGNPLQVAFMLIGGGGNGKGRFLHALETLVGQRNVSSVGLHELIGNRFRAATLYGKLLNVAGDLDPKWLEDTAIFKKITGGDSVQAEHKFGHPFDFSPWATPFYSVNKPFGSADTSEGYWRRWVVLPFPFNHRESTRTAAEIDREITTAGELSGILRRAVGGLRVLLGRGAFVAPPSAVEAKETFRVHGDRVRGWLEECAVLAPGVFTARKVLYESFTIWTEDDHGQAPRSAEFYARLEQIDGVQPVKRRGERGFTGITIRS